MTKWCPRCEQMKDIDIDDFSRCASSKDGRQSYCRSCYAAYGAVHREKITAQNRAYYAANREKVLARTRAYDAAHREERRLAGRWKFDGFAQAVTGCFMPN